MLTARTLALLALILSTAAAAASPVRTLESVVLHDLKRHRDLDLRIFAPAKGGPFPVIIFSHGAGGTKDSNGRLAEFWARHGYVVVLPTHPERRTRPATDDAEFWRERENRVRDISFIIASLPGMKLPIDPAHIGVGGHSAGANTAAVTGGAIVARLPHDLADPRVSAVLLLAGWGKGVMGLNQQSWKTLKLPMMAMTGSKDVARGGTEAFEASPPGDKYQVYIDGASHALFSGDAPPQEVNALMPYVETCSLAFWDAYMKHHASARTWLESHELEKASHGRAGLKFR